MTWLRASVGGMCLTLIFTASGAAQITPLTERVFNEQVLRPNGQPVVPLYEGFYQNPDGSYQICFGYFNLNTEVDIDVPLGPNNKIEPAEFDGMQPTHFDRVPAGNYRRYLCVFSVTVPEGFGQQEVQWTLNTGAEPLMTPGKVLSSYILDEPDSGGRGEVAPVLSFEEGGPTFKGRNGFTGERRRVAVGDPLTLSVWIDHPEDRVWVGWRQHQGPGQVRFGQSEMVVPTSDGVATTSATFSQPGEYLIRVQSINNTASFEFHCCWTNGYVPVTVVP